MKGFVWSVAAVVGLAWTGLAWLLHSLAGTGGAAVVSISRWLDIDPDSTQWIADTLALAGGIAQWLVLIVWLIGAAVVLMLGWLGGRAIDGARFETGGMHESELHGRSTIIDGQVHDKKVS